MKPLMPTLKERKRYLVFTVLSSNPNQRFTNFEDIKNSIIATGKDYFGTIGLSESGLVFLPEKWSQEKQIGVIKVSHDYVDKMKAVFCLVQKINNEPAIVKSIATTGVLNKVDVYLKDGKKDKSHNNTK